MKAPKPDNPDGLFCSKCFKNFPNINQLEQHEWNCFLGRRYPCPWSGCKHVNPQKSLIQQHYRSIHLNKPFTCRSCGKECTYKKTRDKHEKEVHGTIYEHPSDNEDLDPYEEGDSEASTSRQSKPAKLKQELVTFKYNCQKCSFSTDDKTGFSAHAASHLDLKPFSCSFCQKSFVKQSGLTKHIAVCDEAQQQLYAKQQMSSSSSDTGQQVKPPPPAQFECSVTTCGKVFTSQDKYQEHFKSMHIDPLHVSGEEIYYCEACIMRLFTKGGFTAHLHAYHDG